MSDHETLGVAYHQQDTDYYCGAACAQMNDRRPPAVTNWFALFSLATEDAVSRKIVWSIHQLQAEEDDGIDRGATIGGIQLADQIADKGEVEGTIDLPVEMILRDECFQRPIAQGTELTLSETKHRRLFSISSNYTDKRFYSWLGGFINTVGR